MAVFVYKAKEGPDRTIDGEVEAASQKAAVSAVEALGYSPVFVREKQSGAAGRKRSGRVRHFDVTIFTRQLASLTRSGVPILRALRTIADQTENGRLAGVAGEIESTVRDGNMLSDAMSKHPGLFPEVYVNMVRSGEAGGVLDSILDRLADAREKEEDLRRKVQAAVAYPALIVCVGIATVFVLLSFFLPRIAALFEKQGDLPLPTRLLVGISDFFSAHWYWIVVAAVLVGAVLNRVVSLERGRQALDALQLRMPLLGGFLCRADIARFVRTLALLTEAGVPIERALKLAAGTLRNSILRAEVDRVREQTIRRGMPLSAGLKQSPHFPPLVANMVAVGEEGGRLEEVLMEIGTHYEKGIEMETRLATSLLEPVLILVVGGIVGFIVAAMLLPIFKLSSSL